MINKHYCQDELKSVALFVEAEPCHQPKMKHCPFHNPPQDDDGEESHKKGCCEDESEYVKVEDEQLSSSFQFELHLNQVLIATIFVALQIELPSLDSQTIHYLNYKPPLIVCDLPVRLQTFLC